MLVLFRLLGSLWERTELAPTRFSFLPSYIGARPYLTEELGPPKCRAKQHRQRRPGAVHARGPASGSQVPAPPKGRPPQRPASPASSFAHLQLPVAPRAARGPVREEDACDPTACRLRARPAGNAERRRGHARGWAGRPRPRSSRLACAPAGAALGVSEGPSEPPSRRQAKVEAGTQGTFQQ